LTPSPTLSPTPSAPQLTPKSNTVNCRSGPDVAYASLDTFNSGQTAVITGETTTTLGGMSRSKQHKPILLGISQCFDNVRKSE